MATTTPDLWLFFLLVAGVIALPGMDMAYVGGSALARGLRGGLVAVAGIVTGGGIHMLVGATGIAALLLWHPAAYDVLLVAGAAYMAWIGMSLWRAGDDGGGVDTRGPVALPAIFGRAVLTCLLNPKAYAFMLAVLPAFLRTPEHTIAAQALRLSAIIAVTQAVVYGGVALSVAGARRWTGTSARSRRWSMRGVGATLLAGAVLTLLLAWR